MRPVFVLFVLMELFSFSSVIAGTEISDTNSNPKLVIRRINLLGNKTTKSFIILRELTFQEGDSLTNFELLTQFESSKQNLLNTSLFNFADFRFVMVDTSGVEVYIAVTERWYQWIRPVFQLAETNFNSWWENKDFSRINYGIDYTRNNFRGRNEKIELTLQFGFTEKLALSYALPYINKKRTIGLTVFGEYGQNHEVNYLSYDNKRLFYKDVARVQLRNTNAGFMVRYRKKIYNSHYLGLAYNQVDISDSVKSYNPDFLTPSVNNIQYLTLSYRYILDKRDNKNYALTGYYASASVVKYGLDVFYSNIDLTWSQLEYKHYWKTGKKTFLAGMTQFRFFMNEFQPYYFRDGLNYNDKSTVRSYELYVIDAQQMGNAKLQFKYQLISPQAYEMAFVPINKFKKIHYSVYLGIFGDAGYAVDNQDIPLNNLANDLQHGYGFSLDIATYYDLVFRAEYSVNKFGEHGLFLHFVAPI